MRVLMLCVLFALGCAKKESAPAPAASAQAEKEKAPFKEMTIEDVEKRIAAKDGHTFIFDANPKEVYEKRHLPGAVYVPDAQVTASLLPADKNATLIFYCANTH